MNEQPTAPRPNPEFPIAPGWAFTRWLAELSDLVNALSYCAFQGQATLARVYETHGVSAAIERCYEGAQAGLRLVENAATRKNVEAEREYADLTYGWLKMAWALEALKRDSEVPA